MQLPNVESEGPYQQAPPIMSPAPRPQPAPLTPQAPPEVPTTTERTFETPQEKNRRSLALLFTVGIIVILLLAAAAVYFIQKRNANNNGKQNGATSLDSPASNAKGGDLAALSGLDFGVPADLDPYTGDSSTASGYHVYLTQGATADKGCSLEFGINSAEQLPGKDAEMAINTQVEALKSAGAAVTGPSKGPTLKLKSGDGKSVYNVPTTNYQFAKDGKYVSVHYSLVVLKGGQRAVISRQCVNTGGAPDGGSLDKIEASAKELTINPTKQ
jgi:hypothetical protein